MSYNWLVMHCVGREAIYPGRSRRFFFWLGITIDVIYYHMSSISLTASNKQSLKRLLRTGRWGNESEIVRYGIHLVEMEVRAKQRELWPEAISNEEMTRFYQRESKRDRAAMARLAKYSTRLKPEPIE